MTDRPDLSALRREPSTTVPRPRRSFVRRVAIPGVLLLAFAALGAWAARDSLRPRLDVRTVPVVMKSASGASGAALSRAAGWIEPDPWAVGVSALADGVVRDMRVNEGDRVEAGQVVATLDDTDARIEVEMRTQLARAAHAEAALARAERENDALSVTAGLASDEGVAESVLRGAEHARDAALRAAEAARAASEGAAARLRRAEAERAHGIGTAAAVDEAAAAARETAATAAAAGDAVLGAERRIEEARRLATSASDARRAGVRGGRSAALAAAEVERAEAEAAAADAQLSVARLALERCSVRAPSAGVVLERIAAPGTRLGAAAHGTDVLTLYDPAHIQVRVDVPLADAANVGAGRRARVTVEALPGRVFDGEVIRVVPQADVVKNTVQAKVRIAAPDPAMRPGMLARVEFLASDGGPAAPDAVAGRAVFVPERLVQRDGDRATAWVVEDGRAVRRDLRLGGGRDGDLVEVAEGLRPGDDVIDADPATLSDGRAVRVAEDVR